MPAVAYAEHCAAQEVVLKERNEKSGKCGKKWEVREVSDGLDGQEGDTLSHLEPHK